MQTDLEAVTQLLDSLIAFAVAYGFQLVGALVVFVLGLVASNWIARQAMRWGERKGFDPTLTKFAANVVRIILLGFVIIITLGNFGITITPFIALAGAAAFGATLAMQGLLSNYGAGLAIILTRPFVVGDTITVRVVDEIKLAATILKGEDDELITIPNKQIMGEILVNSQTRRVVEGKIVVPATTDADNTIEVIRQAIAQAPEIVAGSTPQIGIHEFGYAGIVMGFRVWVPSLHYYPSRYALNGRILKALHAAGIRPVSSGSVAFLPDLQPQPGLADPDPQESL